MNKKEIQELAKKLKMPYFYPNGDIVNFEKLQDFVEFAIAEEREECAKVCERYTESYDDVARKTATKCVIDIRNRQKPLDKPDL